MNDYDEPTKAQRVNRYVAENAAQADENTLAQEAESALDLCHQLHQALDDLEQRLFHIGPQEVPKGGLVTGAQVRPRVPLAETLRHTRQRLDNATARLGKIIPRI